MRAYVAALAACRVRGTRDHRGKGRTRGVEGTGDASKWCVRTWRTEFEACQGVSCSDSLPVSSAAKCCGVELPPPPYFRPETYRSHNPKRRDHLEDLGIDEGYVLVGFNDTATNYIA